MRTDFKLIILLLVASLAVAAWGTDAQTRTFNCELLVFATKGSGSTYNFYVLNCASVSVAGSGFIMSDESSEKTRTILSTDSHTAPVLSGSLVKLTSLDVGKNSFKPTSFTFQVGEKDCKVPVVYEKN